MVYNLLGPVKGPYYVVVIPYILCNYLMINLSHLQMLALIDLGADVLSGLQYCCLRHL